MPPRIKIECICISYLEKREMLSSVFTAAQNMDMLLPEGYRWSSGYDYLFSDYSNTKLWLVVMINVWSCSCCRVSVTVSLWSGHSAPSLQLPRCNEPQSLDFWYSLLAFQKQSQLGSYQEVKSQGHMKFLLNNLWGLCLMTVKGLL